MEKNLIGDREIKENLVDISINLLRTNNIIRDKDIKNVQVHFGYIFSKDAGEVEAFF